MHEGIDIGVGYGTPIHAAASGRVIYAGWMEGYLGNLVAIDHGRGISTAYGHQSSVAVSNGETVSQGQSNTFFVTWSCCVLLGSVAYCWHRQRRYTSPR